MIKAENVDALVVCTFANDDSANDYSVDEKNIARLQSKKNQQKRVKTITKTNNQKKKQTDTDTDTDTDTHTHTMCAA